MIAPSDLARALFVSAGVEIEDGDCDIFLAALFTAGWHLNEGYKKVLWFLKALKVLPARWGVDGIVYTSHFVEHKRFILDICFSRLEPETTIRRFWGKKYATPRNNGDPFLIARPGFVHGTRPPAELLNRYNLTIETFELPASVAANDFKTVMPSPINLAASKAPLTGINMKASTSPAVLSETKDLTNVHSIASKAGGSGQSPAKRTQKAVPETQPDSKLSFGGGESCKSAGLTTNQEGKENVGAPTALSNLKPPPAQSGAPTPPSFLKSPPKKAGAGDTIRINTKNRPGERGNSHMSDFAERENNF